MLNRQQKGGWKGMKLTCYVTDKKIGSEKEREWEEVPRTSLLINADLASLDSPSDAVSIMLELPFCVRRKKNVLGKPLNALI